MSKKTKQVQDKNVWNTIADAMGLEMAGVERMTVTLEQGHVVNVVTEKAAAETVAAETTTEETTSGQ